MIKYYFAFLFFCLSISKFHLQPSAVVYQNVKQFGAKGDGLTDDSGAFQKAVDYCEKNNIKTLLIPDGKFLIKKSVVFNRGGLQILGTGALLREESWQKTMGKQFENHEPFLGCTIMVEKDVEAMVFAKTVADPVRFSNIQFLAKQGRTRGKTVAISFKSEFEGPTWPFIVEYCNFRGFNFAIKFESPTQYCVAFVQLRNNAFSQNDECIYFANIPEDKIKNIGMRNLTWGFEFRNNQCHDNSRVIRAAFAKDLVNIISNNMEGNIPYSDGKPPKNIVDIELSNATINFEGNHFESVISDCVYISSAFMKQDGSFYPYSGSTSLGELNKIFLKGNNFDGINTSLYKTLVLKGMNVFNYDPYPLFLDECNLRQNDVNDLNLYMSDTAKLNGTSIKTPFPKYEIAWKIQSGYATKKDVLIPGKTEENMNFPSSSLNFLKINKKNTPIFGIENQKIPILASDDFIGVTYIVNNPLSVAFLGVGISFHVSYSLNGKSVSEVKSVSGNYGTSVGTTSITGLIPNYFPSNAKNIHVWSVLETNAVGETDFFVANKYSLFTFRGKNPYLIPVY